MRTAITMADADGLDALTLRKLASRLGVEAMSLYRHVANKGDLVHAMVDAVMGEIELPADEPEWRPALRTVAINANSVFLRHSWTCAVLVSPKARMPGKATLRYSNWLLERLHCAGFPPELAYHAYHTLDGHTVGYTLWQLSHTTAAQNLGSELAVRAFMTQVIAHLHQEGWTYLAQHAEQYMAASHDDCSTAFAFGLDLILSGLENARANARICVPAMGNEPVVTP